MKSNQTLFLFLISFFLVVGIGSLLLFAGGGSINDRNRDSIGATTAALTDTIIASTEDSEDEKAAEIADSAETEEKTEEVKEETEEAEPVEEEKEEPEEKAPEYEKRYLMYTIKTERHALRLRALPSEDADILKKLNRSTSGYVIKPGNQWCKVITVNGLEGYLATEYLSFEEMTEDTFPSDIVNKVEAPDEALNF